MGDAAKIMHAFRSFSTDDSYTDTEVRPSNVAMSTQNLGVLGVYDPLMVSRGRQIGRGGQGNIYKAKFYSPFSFKPLHMALKKFATMQGVSQGQFPQEIFSVECSSICKPIGVIFEGDSLCTIMPRYSCDMRDWINSSIKGLQVGNAGYDGPPFPEQDAMAIITKNAEALKALHACGIYHADLKAANILVKKTLHRGDAGGDHYHFFLGVADFERSEGVVGTGFWRAPEVLQCLKLSTKVSLSKDQWLMADIYSFGMICYEVLTGKIPFDGYRFSNYDLVLNGGRPELPEHVPNHLKDIVRRCWDADPNSRPSWANIIQALALNRDKDHVAVDIYRKYIDNLVRLDSAIQESVGSVITGLKQSVGRHMELFDRESKGFANYLYWALEFVATAEQYVSKFDVESPLERSTSSSFDEFVERAHLYELMEHQVIGCDLMTYASLPNVQIQCKPNRHILAFFMQKEELLVSMRNIYRRIHVVHNRYIHAACFKTKTGMQTLLLFGTSFNWQLWCGLENGRRLSIMECLLSTWETFAGTMDGFYFFYNSGSMVLCSTVINFVCTYVYTLAIFSSEPIMLCLQYGVYRIMKRSNILYRNILYRSCGYRICRLQRAWMNFIRYKLLSVALIFSLYFLFTRYGLKGILVWNIFPCIFRCSSY